MMFSILLLNKRMSARISMRPSVHKYKSGLNINYVNIKYLKSLRQEYKWFKKAYNLLVKVNLYKFGVFVVPELAGTVKFELVEALS